MSTGGDDFEFGPFRLDSGTSVVWRGEDVVPLTPKATALLRALVEGAGDLVTLNGTNASCADVALLEAKGVTVTSDCP